jgi:hypothetical protein
VTEEEGEMGRGVRDGLAGKFEAAAVGEDEGEGLGKGCVGGWCGGDVDFEEGGGGSAAIGVEGGEGEAAGGAEGGTGESAGVVVGKEGLNLGGGAAGFSERHSYTKTESGRFGNHGVGLAVTLHVGSVEAGPRVAAILSEVETCRRLGIPVREYLAEVLPGLADRKASELRALTPMA